jgi:hypothetical protein
MLHDVQLTAPSCNETSKSYTHTWQNNSKFITYIIGEDNIKMDLKKVGCGFIDWIGLDQDRDRWRTLVNAVINLRVP